MEVIHKIGRRKTAVARVYVSEGKGNITVNNKDIKEVFPVPHSPCNPTVIGVSLRVIKLDNAKLYFSTFNKSSDLSEIGLSVIELIKNILLLF